MTIDEVIIAFDKGLRTLAAEALSVRPSPAAGVEDRLLADDEKRLDERVDKLKSHFAMTEKDLRDVDISADRITKRGQRILDVDLGEEPTALPKPK